MRFGCCGGGGGGVGRGLMGFDFFFNLGSESDD